MNPKLYSFMTVLICISVHALAQPFLKSYNEGPAATQLYDLVSTGNGGYAFIESQRLVLLNHSGDIIKTWSLTENDVSLQRVARAESGKFYLTAAQADFNGFIVYILSANAELEDTRRYGFDQLPYNIQIETQDAGGYTIAYILPQEDKPGRLFVHRFDASGKISWTKTIVEGIVYNYKMRRGSNGIIELAYISAADNTLKLLKVGHNGTSTEQNISAIFREAEMELPYTFSPAPDGGYLFCASEYNWDENPDLLLMKTDATGKPQWTRLIDINMTDLLADAVCTRDAIFLLSNSGYRMNWEDMEGGDDIALTKLDLQGNFIWKKGYGSNTDIEKAVKLLITGDELLIGCHGKPDRLKQAGPILIRTGLDGGLPDHPFPHPLQPLADLKKMDLQLSTRTEELVQSIPMEDGGMIGVARVLGKTEDDYMVSAFRTNMRGEKIWVHFLSDFPAMANGLSKTGDGNFVTLIKDFEYPWKMEYAVKFAADGQLIWRKEVWGLEVNDITAGPDGSVYLTGAKLITSGVVHALIVKLDAAGNEVWNYSYPIPGKWVKGTCIDMTPEGEIIVAGTASVPYGAANEVYLLHADNTGAALRAMLYRKTDTTMIPAFVAGSSDRHFLIGGYSEGIKSGNRDAWLMKVTHLMATVWNHSYDISLTDEAVCFTARGDTAYCLGGTTGEPEFGTRKKFGFLANIRKDGLLNDLKFFGRENSQLSVENIAAASGNRLIFAGSIQERDYGVTVPYSILFDPQIVLSAGDQSGSNHVRLYPNPASNAAWLIIENQVMGKLQISITDSRGVRVRNLEESKRSSRFSVFLPLQGLPAGIYLVEVRTEKGRAIKKLLVTL